MGITLWVVDRIKLGGDKWAGQVLVAGKVKGRSILEFLGVKVVTEVVLCDIISDGRGFFEIAVGSWTRKKLDIHW